MPEFMSDFISKLNVGRRFFFVLLTWVLGLGLVLLVIASAAHIPSVHAEVEQRPEPETELPVKVEQEAAPLAPQLVDLQAVKDGPDNTYAGRVITYTIRITNHTSSPIANVIVTDTWVASESSENPQGGKEIRQVLPAAFNGNYWTDPPDFVDAFTYTLPTEEEMTGRARWDLVSPLTPNFQGTIQFTMWVSIHLQPLHGEWWNAVGPSTLGNSVGITAAGTIASKPDNVATAILGPILQLQKSSATEPNVGPRPGRLITYTLRLDNLERSDSVPGTDIEIRETLPAELIFQKAWAEVPGTTIDFDPLSRFITWTLAPTFTLNPGQATTVAFSTHLSTTQEWKIKINNDKTMCQAMANELAEPVLCWADEQVETLGIFDKTYVTEPDHRGTLPLPENQSYPNRFITYTVYVFNPLTDTVAHNLRITDVMPSTWDFVEMVDGNDPVWPQPLSAITNTAVWEWPGAAIAANGFISFTFLAHIGPDTPVQGPHSCGIDYYNDLAGSADEFPILYAYGKTFEHNYGLAELEATNQIELKKDVYDDDEGPGQLIINQLAGEPVTYTIIMENWGDQPVSTFIVTDTLPPYFVYDGMVDLGPTPVYSPDNNTLVWSLPITIEAHSQYTMAFRAIADGSWEATYENALDAYSPETTFCPKGGLARVKVLSPIIHDKNAYPPLGSGEWVVQGEWFTYTVEYWNRSVNFLYTIDTFWDELPILKTINYQLVNLEGFAVDGNEFYSTTAAEDGLPFTLLTDEQNSWLHTFTVDTPGYGSGTPWCNSLRIDEDSTNPLHNQEIYQEKATFGLELHSTTFTGTTFNASSEAPIWFKPHVDLFHEVYPKKTGISGTVEVTLTLYNNLRDHQGQIAQAVNGIVVTYTLPEDFRFLNVIGASPAPTTQTEQIVVWEGLDLPAGEGQTLDLHFYVQAPGKEKGLLPVNGYVTALPADPDICIPNSQANYYVTKGVEIDKRPDTKTTGPFGVIEYTLYLINQTTAPVTGLTVTDTLPSGFEFLSLEEGPPPDSIDPLVWRDLYIDPSPISGIGQKAQKMRFRVRASGLFDTEYCNRVEGVSDETNVAYVDNYWDSVCVAVLPGVALYKTVRPKQAQAGESVVYTLTLDNRSGKDIANVIITDTLPWGFNYQGTLKGTAPVSTTPKLLWEVDQLLNLERRQFVFQAAIDEALPTDEYCNQAEAKAEELDKPGSEVTIPDTDLTACVAVQGVPNVERSKSVTPTSVLAGNHVTYTITLYNATGEPQTVRITDTLPSGLTYDGVTNGTPAPALTDPIVWANLSLGISETLTLTFRAQVDADTPAGTYYNRLDARTLDFELAPRTNLAPLQVQEIPRYDLQVSKSDGRTQVDAGDILIYTITYTNANQAGLTLNNVIITDTFGPQLYASPLGLDSGWKLLATDRYTYSVGDVGPGVSKSIAFTLQLATSIPDTVSTISNTVEIGDDTDQPAIETDLDNNRSTDLDVLHGADLIVTGVAISPTQPQAGQPITFSVTVRNQGDDPTTNVSGSRWFPVDLYLKGTGFVPAGEPGAVYSPAVFDHFGSFCADYPDCNQERPEYFVYAAGLDGNAETTLQFNIIVPQADDYAVYVQVDTSFTGAGVGEPWGEEYGLVQEAIETNNIYSHGVIQVSSGPDPSFFIYLPLVVKDG